MCRGVEETLVAGRDSRGTVLYCAPEVFQFGRCFDKKIDSWSLGIILYELLFNTQPFYEKNKNKIIWKMTTEDWYGQQQKTEDP